MNTYANRSGTGRRSRYLSRWLRRSACLGCVVGHFGSSVHMAFPSFGSADPCTGGFLIFPMTQFVLRSIGGELIGATACRGTVRYLSVVNLRLVAGYAIGVGLRAVFMLVCNCYVIDNTGDNRIPKPKVGSSTLPRAPILREFWITIVRDAGRDRKSIV